MKALVAWDAVPKAPHNTTERAYWTPSMITVT